MRASVCTKRAESAAPRQPTIIANAPRSTRSATAAGDPVRLETLTHEARRRIFTPGWAVRCWEAGLGFLVADFQSRYAIEESLDIFDENVRKRSGALEYVREGFLQGAHGSACRESPERATREMITSCPLGSLTSTVLVDGTTLDPDAPAPAGADPAEGIFSEILPSAADGSFPASLWRKEGLTASVDVAERIVALLPGWRDRVPDGSTYLDTTPVQHDGQLLFAAARVDLSSPCAPAELKMFRDAVEPESPVKEARELIDDGGD